MECEIMKVRITVGNGWYQECVGIIFDVTEKISPRYGELLILSQDAKEFGKGATRLIEREHCEILPDELTRLRAELARTQAALDAAGELLEVMEMPCYLNRQDVLSCDWCDKPLDNHSQDCEWGQREQAYTAAMDARASARGTETGGA